MSADRAVDACAARPRYVLAPHVGYVQGEPGAPDGAWLADLRTGPIMVLSDAAALILRCALETTGDELASRVAAASGAELRQVEHASQDFVASLVRDGYLVERAAPE